MENWSVKQNLHGQILTIPMFLMPKLKGILIHWSTRTDVISSNQINGCYLADFLNNAILLFPGKSLTVEGVLSKFLIRYIYSTKHFHVQKTLNDGLGWYNELLVIANLFFNFFFMFQSSSCFVIYIHMNYKLCKC